MKRSIVVFMICLFVLCAASVAFAAEARTSGLFTYEIKGNGTAVITYYDWKKHENGDLYIPNMLDGYTITGIGDMAFRKGGKDVPFDDGTIMAKLPESIVSIGEKAFFECDFIKTINIPASVKIIGAGAFAGTRIICNVDAQNDMFATIDGVLYNKKDKELIFAPVPSYGKLEIPNGIKAIGEYAFYDQNLSVVFPSTLQDIKDYAFSRCLLQGNVVFPESLMTIGNSAFESTRIANSSFSMHFPSNVNKIGERAFKGISIGGWGDDPIIEIDLQSTSITAIPTSAFESTKAKKVLLPNTLKSIDDRAFNNMTRCYKLVIPEGVESIGNGAFEESAIQEISLPSTLKNIDDSAFANIEGLEQVVIPDSVTSIGENIVDRTKVTLVVTPGSYAETWATENGYMIAKQGGDDTSWLNYD